MAAGAVFTGTTKLNTSGMREGFARLRAMTAKAAKDMNQTVNGASRRGTSEPLSGWDKAINSTRDSFARMQSAWANASKAMQYYGTRINKDVLVPLTQATQAAERFAKRAAIAGASLAGFGVYRNFKIEGMEQQFAVLMKDSEAARRKVHEMLNAAAVSPFGLDDYVNSVRMLYTIGGEEMSNKNFIKMMGDAAAVTGKDMQQVASWTAKLYQSLKSGAGVGTSGDDMLRAGLLTAETYAYMKSHGQTVANFNDIWARGMKDLNRFSGGMELIRFTGQGAFNMLKGLAGLAMQDLFAGFSNSVKNVMFNLKEFLRVARDTGRLENWGKRLGEGAAEAVNNIYRLIHSYRLLDEQSRASVNNILAGMAAVAGLQYTGILGPLLKAITGAAFIAMNLIGKAVVFAFTHVIPVAVGALVSAVGAAGFAIGNKIYESISGFGNKIIESAAVILKTIAVMIGKWLIMPFRQVIAAGTELMKGNFVDAALALPSEFVNSISDIVGTFRNSVDKELFAIWKSTGGRAQSGAEAAGEKWSGTLSSAFDVAKNKINKITKDGFKGILKEVFGESPGMEAIDKWMQGFNALKGIKLPEMPKPPDMTVAKQNAEAIAEANRKANAYTIRGYYFRKLDMAAIIESAKNNGKIAEHNRKRELEAKKKEQSKQTLKPIETEFQKSNRLLEEIKRNTGRNSGAVYA